MKVRARDGACRRREEEKARRERKWKRDMQVLEGILELKVANEVAEYAGQFFDCIEHGPDDGIPVTPIENHESDDILPSGSLEPPADSDVEVGSSLFVAGANYITPLYEFE